MSSGFMPREWISDAPTPAVRRPRSHSGCRRWALSRSDIPISHLYERSHHGSLCKPNAVFPRTATNARSLGPRAVNQANGSGVYRGVNGDVPSSRLPSCSGWCSGQKESSQLAGLRRNYQLCELTIHLWHSTI